jgi:ankyrin repeat protein
METRPWQARQENEDKYTPMHLAAYEDKIDVITVLLEHDPFLGYLISTAGKPLLCTAASGGHVGVARELLKHCPDAPYCDANGSTCLHEAVLSGQEEFVEFVLGSQQLQHLINMADNSGETALHLAQSNGLTWIADLLGDEEKIINNGPVSICFSVCDSKKIILPEYHILLSMTSICKSKQWFDHYSFLQYIGHYSEGLQTVDSVFICIN